MPVNAISQGEKVMSLGEAIGTFVLPGSAVHLAYSDARPNAAVQEIIRHFDGTSPELQVSTAGLVNVQHALVTRGLVRRVVTAFAGENFPAPRPNPLFQDAVATGKVEVECWSLYTLIARLIGGAMGVDFFPVTSLRDSDIAREHLGERYATIPSPFNPEASTGVVRSYRPDVVVMQAVAADVLGNTIMAAPYGEALWGALAAKRGVIVCAERIVDTATIRAHNQAAVVPAHLVRAVCEVPFGSHPYGLYSSGVAEVASYTQDEEMIVGLQRLSRDAKAFDAWVDEWVIGVGSHDGYLRKLGTARLSRLRGDAAPGGWQLQVAQHVEPVGDELVPVTDTERMVVAAAHVIVGRVRERRHDVLLAGVGYSNLAAWLAARMLQESGDSVELMAEIGMFGYEPRPGDPFIFALRNFPTCTTLTDVTAVLGAFVGGPATRAIGSVGSGQIDRYGRINSTWAADGRYLVGSGGANDIASNADELVVTVKHTPERLVPEVPYITTPGDRVHTIVTTEGVLERVDGEFELRRYFARQGESPDQAAQRITALTGWPLKVSNHLEAEPAPSTAELSIIRQFDPRRTFLR